MPPFPLPSPLPVVGVFGSGDPEHRCRESAFEVGRRVARAGAHLLTGGGRGVMEDASRGFAAERQEAREARRLVPGLALGILPGGPADTEREGEAPPGYPNPWLDLVIRTHLDGEDGPDSPSSRNRINVLTAHRVLVLPGRVGTAAELRLALKLGKPVLVVLPGDWEETDDGEPDSPFRTAVRELAARGRSQPQARASNFSSNQGGNSAAESRFSEAEKAVRERRVGGKGPLGARLDFCHGLLPPETVAIVSPGDPLDAGWERVEAFLMESIPPNKP